MHPASLTGMVGVKLSDVPLKIRRRAGSHLTSAMMKDGDGGDPVTLVLKVSEMETAIEEPSDRIHYVPRVAYEKARAKWPRP